MNNDIITMIELQKYWDAVMSSRTRIEKIMVGIKAGEKNLTTAKTALNSLGEKIKELKTSIKQHELDLTDMSNRIKKLDERKRNVQTERELKALEKEIDVLKFDIATLEEKTLALIDDLDQKQMNFEHMEKQVNADEDTLKAGRPTLEKEIFHHEDIIRNNESSFNEISVKLSIAHRSKFLKIIGSRDGKAIAKVEDEICGYCNRKIPASLAIDASKDDKVVNCTNCGKYIYR
jgi:uncharacterized protein